MIFVSRKHEVCDSCLECQQRVLLYKSDLYKACTSKDEAMRACVLYQLRWKRPDEVVTFSSLTPKNGHKKK